ncbi:ribokinase [Granulicella cerasi]|uniref:Ribokinase n=1 Tax=Granulicella cerasi TaxID=741063 RepID=A0ABW1Z7K9_9BACT|nr:ribokinase [Granulicella cerasi]
MKKKIVVVGSLNLDLVANVERMPAEGETMLGQAFATYPGGKGANQAVAAAKLGGEVMMVGRLGNDLFAEELRRELANVGVNARCVENVECASGSAVILVTPQGANSIVVIPGANATLRPEDLDDYTDVFRDAGVILSQLEIPLDTVERLGQIAAELNVPFVLDPAPVQALSAATLRCVTWLTPNETETQLLLQQLGYSVDDSLSEDAVHAAADRLLATGARNVILKLGGRGIYLAGADVAGEFVSPFVVKAVDTTAAGDAFNGGFAYGLTRGMAPVEAAKFACAVAAVSVTRVGAQPSMPTLQEAETLLGVPVAS